ncbi:MAG: glycine cleavage system aminomethyltransferase GcvT [Bacteroides sp.]|nr:glycine cleavage system aminomethyltransferase GcvT [Bacteroidales bacterium]MBD5316145.1 glycine cleavage system aminomethyltransferase GcvT [Bacteroides sp.]MBD5377936.1 glycine cleavage system aminomethyltransferase GcvT [Bacteroides sp.]
MKTCLYDKHVALGALMSPFAGFDMPISYRGITEEHQAVRNHAGVFDVSHMGEFYVGGARAQEFLDRVFTNDLAGLADGHIAYGMFTRQDGGVVDDLLVYRRNKDSWFLVVNAANIDKDFAWLEECRKSEGFEDVDLRNLSAGIGELALQGPEAEEVMRKVFGLELSDLEFYSFRETEIDGKPVLVSRTGYTGEDGFEIYSAEDVIVKVWDALMAAGVEPCGLGCRDTLRFEVGLPLYGHELADDITPVEGSLSMFCKLDKPAGFLGSDVLARQKAEGPKRRIVGLELLDRAIPRAGYEVLNPEGEVVGHITTGYRGISVDKSIAMALVDAAWAARDTELQVRIRRKTFPARVIPRRFYKKSYKK